MQKKIAEDLLKIGAVFLRPEEPFIWASGIKSPVYCDNRLTLSVPEVRDEIDVYKRQGLYGASDVGIRSENTAL